MDDEIGLVSVIVPVYNAAEYLEYTIQSVIDQTYTSWELLLIDDGSKDNSVEIINRFSDNKKIFLLQHPGGVNLGVSKTRELGIERAKGKYISFLDADDVFYPDKLRNQLEIFSAQSEVILVHSKVRILNNSELEFNNEFQIDKTDKSYKLNEQKSWLTQNRICNSTVMVRSHVLKEIQFGLPQLFQYEDWLLWTLLAEKGEFYYQNDPQIQYRIHEQSATAGILKNELIAPYSKIEFLISLYSLSNSDHQKDIIIKKLKKTIISLFEIYSDDDLIKLNSFKLDFYNNQGNIDEIRRNYNEITLKHSILQDEIKNIRNSKVFKIRNKFKNFLKR